MSALTINDRLLHYEVIGKGRPVLFLHNFIGSWRYWMGAMETLSPKFRCYSFDLWGMGDSDKSPELYTLNTLLETTKVFLDEMGISRAAIVGHGFGAVLANAFSSLYPHRVERQILIDPSNQSLQQDLARLGFAKALDLVKKDTEIDIAVITESLKTDPLAFQTYKNLSPSEIAEVPTLIIESYSIKGHTSTSQRLILEMENPSLFPVLHYAVEMERLIAEYLYLTSDQISRPMQIKKYWKRLIR